MKGIDIKNVTKRYKTVTALEDVTLSFAPGRIVGLLGRNGAGKSTLLNIIANRIYTDSGSVTIDGERASDNPAVHEKLFCMSDADLYTPSMRVCDHFKWTARFYDSFDEAQAHALAARFKLDEGKRFAALSKGYQSIFKLVIALAMNVPYVIFDEPVLGLDAGHRELFYKLLLEKYEREENTIIIATHLIEEVAPLIEDVVFIDDGRVLLAANVETLLAHGYVVSGATAEVDAYCAGKHVIGEEAVGTLKRAYVLDECTPIAAGAQLQLSALSLQKLFIQLTSEEGTPWEN